MRMHKWHLAHRMAVSIRPACMNLGLTRRWDLDIFLAAMMLDQWTSPLEISSLELVAITRLPHRSSPREAVACESINIAWNLRRGCGLWISKHAENVETQIESTY